VVLVSPSAKDPCGSGEQLNYGGACERYCKRIDDSVWKVIEGDGEEACHRESEHEPEKVWSHLSSKSLRG
jgi:hypothetical protein